MRPFGAEIRKFVALHTSKTGGFSKRRVKDLTMSAKNTLSGDDLPSFLMLGLL